MTAILPNVLPILLLLSLGYYMKIKQILKQSTITEINKLVVNMALPALLFLNFRDMELKIEYLTLTIIIFIFFLLIYLIGEGLNKIKPLYNPILPFMLPGFAFGTLGIPFYLSIFGIENLSNFTILSIGHEFFVWFVLVVMIKIKLSGEHFSTQTIKDFIKNPFILAVTIGIIINITGFNEIIKISPILQGIEKFMEYLGTLVTPLILIVVGYGLKINKKYLKESIKILLIRMSLLLTIGYIIKFTLLDKILEANQFFDYAWFTFLILPQSYVLVLLIGKYSTEENRNIAINTSVLGTIVSIAIYIIFTLAITT